MKYNYNIKKVVSLTLIFVCVTVHAAMLDDVNVDELLAQRNVRYSNSFKSSIRQANRLHQAQIKQADVLLQSEDDVIIIQKFLDFGKGLYTWVILPEDAVDEAFSEADKHSLIRLNRAEWVVLAKWIHPPFPDVLFNGDDRSQGVDPFTFVRVLFKEDGFSSINYYVNPIGSMDFIKSSSDGDSDSFKSAQNSFGLICSIENLRRMTVDDLFSDLLSFRNLGEAFLSGEDILLLRAAESCFDKKSDAINRLVND